MGKEKTLRVGIVGFGFMGQTHFRCWSQQKDTEVVAICDTDTTALQKATTGNINTGTQTNDFSNVSFHTGLQQMLTKEHLDAVSITLPTYLHAQTSIQAIEAGVHVLCEKPMALNVSDCQKMLAASENTNRILQIGHCIRFWPEYAAAKKLIADNTYGKIIAATFRRLSPLPDWSADNWLADQTKSGGMPLDLHIHDTDFVQCLLGTPKAVRAFAARDTAGNITHICSNFIYDDDKTISAEAGWTVTSSFGFEMSFVIMCEKATLLYNCNHKPAFTIHPEKSEAVSPQLEAADGYTLQIEHFTKRIRKTEVPKVTDLKQSMNSVRIVQAEIESAQKSKVVVID